jgi:signal transduction histidine kinase
VAGPDSHGTVLLCNERGRVLRVVHDKLGLVPGGAGGRLELCSLVDACSEDKTRAFLDAVAADGAAFGWEVNVPLGGRLETLRLMGVGDDEGVWLAAAPSEEDFSLLYEDLVRINNEHVNRLRWLARDNAAMAREADDRQHLFDEISRLNNEHVNMQRELARKNRQLESLNEQKNMLLGMAAHDMRNPLGNIRNMSGFLKEDLAGRLDKDSALFLDHIESLSNFMLRLIDDILDLSNIDSGRLVLETLPTDLAGLAERTVALHRPMAEQKGVTLEFTARPGLPFALVDPGKMSQVLDNLLSNAVKFSPEGGTVRVGVDLGLLADVPAPAFTVADEGPGMDAEDTEHLFTPFKRAKTRATGGEKSTGLGLAIVQRMVRGHKGRIDVDTAPGRGTAFTVTLPAA